MTTKEDLKVIFRVFPEGDVIAIFPEVPGNDWRTCNSYQHIGQHSACDLGIIVTTRLAKPTEYADLLAELTQIYEDYNLVVTKKITSKNDRIRFLNYFIAREEEKANGVYS